MNRLIALGILALTLSATAKGADDPGNSPRPKELDVLSVLEGKWTGDFAIEDRPETKTSSTTVGQWRLKDSYLISQVETTDARGLKQEAMIVWGYHQGRKKFTRNYFFSNGQTFNEAGDWNPDTKTFTFEEVDPVSGATKISTMTVVDPKTLNWTITIQPKDGSQSLRIKGTNKKVG